MTFADWFLTPHGAVHRTTGELRDDYSFVLAVRLESHRPFFLGNLFTDRRYPALYRAQPPSRRR